MITPAQENARMLASILGIDEDEAAKRLDRNVLITAPSSGPAARWLREIATLVEKTIGIAHDETDIAHVELVIGNVAPRTTLPRLHASLDAAGATISIAPVHRASGEPHPLLSALAACAAAAATIRAALNDPALPTVTDPLILDFTELGIPSGALERAVDLTGSVLVGAGAVGHGFLRALRNLNARGTLYIVDPKRAGPGNPNRCLYLTPDDVGEWKAEALAARAAVGLSGMRLVPRVEEFSAYCKAEGPPPTAIVTVDSRVTRRLVQKEMPGRVLDASTTDVRAVVVHSHRQPNPDACLACIYRHVPDELARERSIADGLGIDLAAVRQGFVTPEVAVRIHAAHPQVDQVAITGMAFDSLFKQLCAAQALQTPEGRQVLAPFAFVSCLAGALLVIEMLRSEAGGTDTNYWSVDPWGTPINRVRRKRPRAPSCEFCSRPKWA